MDPSQLESQWTQSQPSEGSGLSALFFVFGALHVDSGVQRSHQRTRTFTLGSLLGRLFQIVRLKAAILSHLKAQLM